MNTKSHTAVPTKPPAPSANPPHAKSDATHAAVPKWAAYHGKMAGEFPSPFRGTPIRSRIRSRNSSSGSINLRPEKGGPAYLGKSGALQYKYPDVKNVEIPQNMGDLDTVLDDVVNLYEGAVNWGNPLTMCNVIPQPNTAAVIATMLSQVFPANILEANMLRMCISPS